LRIVIHIGMFDISSIIEVVEYVTVIDNLDRAVADKGKTVNTRNMVYMRKINRVDMYVTWNIALTAP